MDSSTTTTGRAIWAQLGTFLAAVGASLCCMAPVLFISIGIGGSWMNPLTALEPYRPIFILATVPLLGFAGWQLYRREDDCAPDEACVNPAVKRRQRLTLWLPVIPVLALLTFPWYAPAFL